MHPIPLQEAIFEKGDDVLLAGPLASLAWFSVAMLTVLSPDHSHALAAAFATIGIGLAVWSIRAARRPASRHTQQIFPWFIFLAVSVELLGLATASPKALWGLQ